jgi:hypothetical protein
MANLFFKNLKNPFVGFASPFFFFGSPGCEIRQKKKKKPLMGLPNF